MGFSRIHIKLLELQRRAVGTVPSFRCSHLLSLHRDGAKAKAMSGRMLMRRMKLQVPDSRPGTAVQV